MAHGRTMFESELKHLGITIAMLTTEEMLPHILEKVRFNSLEEMYAAIGYGGASAQKCANRAREELVHQDRPAGGEAGRPAGRRPAGRGGEGAGRPGLRGGQGGQQEALGLRGHRLGDDGVHGEVRQVLHPCARGPHRGLHHPGVRGVRPPGGLPQRRGRHGEPPRRRTGGSRSAGTRTASTPTRPPWTSSPRTAPAWPWTSPP